MLHWDPLDFMTVLECEPQEYDEDYGATVYEIERDGLVLYVAVSPDYQSLQIDIHRESEQLVSVAVYVGGDVRRFYEKQVEYLIATDCLVIPNWWNSHEVIEPKDYKSGLSVKIFLKPHIQVVFC